MSPRPTIHALLAGTAGFCWAAAPRAGGDSLEVALRPVVAGAPLALDSLRFEKAGGEVFSVARLSGLLSGFALERADGGWLELGLDAAFFDFGRGRDRFTIDGVPPGRYRALRFSVGLDAEQNAADPAVFPAGHALNPAVNRLHWSWQGGYVFLAVEGHYRIRGGGHEGYLLHLGNAANRVEISVAAPLEIDGAAGMVLDFDVAALLGLPEPIAFGSDGASTHSREGDPLAAKLVANLPGAFRVLTVSAASRQAPPELLEPLYLPPRPEPFPFTMGATFPMPGLPADNPLLVGRVDLGRQLFGDPRLSRDGTVSCASCHHVDKAFTDGLPTSVGIDGRTGQKNAMPLFNLAWKERFFWDGRARSLREQVLMPIEAHDEMDADLGRVVGSLAGEGAAFERAFGAPEVSEEKIALALEAFLLTLTSHGSKFDRAMAGETELTERERRGFELFITEREPRSGHFGADCFHCHGGALFTDGGFHHNGLPGNDGAFATPSLRNVALTAPYMHDGRFATLEEVVAHYSSGVERSENLAPNLAKHPAGGLGLSADDQAALVAFLKTLTDPKFQDTSQR